MTGDVFGFGYLLRGTSEIQIRLDPGSMYEKNISQTKLAPAGRFKIDPKVL